MNFTSHQTGRLFACCCLLVSLAQTQPLSAAVTVQTADGRVLTGEVDEQTDARLLWIRQQSEQIVLTTSVPWSSITAATRDGAALSLTELPEQLRQHVTSQPVGFLVQQVVYHAPSSCQGECPPTPPVRRPIQSASAHVRSLSVEAFVVNLDRDVEPDGIQLVIAALDERGRPVPVKGNLSVKLWGERNHPHGSLIGFEELQRWNQPVVPVDFEDGVASYALRFRTVRPEFDFSLHPEALVNVRLGVFGQGNFAASVPIVIRPFNPVRDRLQLYRGHRFFRNELTEEVRHVHPTRIHTGRDRRR